MEDNYIYHNININQLNDTTAKKNLLFWDVLAGDVYSKGDNCSLFCYRRGHCWILPLFEHLILGKILINWRKTSRRQ